MLSTDTQSSGQAKRSSVRRWLISAVMVTLLAAMAAHISVRPEEVAYFRRLSTPVVVITLVLQFLSQLLFNEALRLPLRTYVKGLGYWEFFMVRTGGSVAGHVVPVAGSLAVRLTYLRRRGLTYVDFAWATLLSNVLALVAAGVLALFATGILWRVAGTPPALVLGLSAAVAALSVMALTLFQLLPGLARHPRLQKWRRLSGMSGFTASRRTMIGVFALSLARHCLNFVTFGLLYQSLSRAPSGVLTGGLVYALTSPLRMVNITPGNLGVNEWVVAIAGKALTFDVTTGLIVALVFRGIALAAQGLGVLVGWAWLALWSKS
jgi:hypothetical protein